jgi:hypothetical protein
MKDYLPDWVIREFEEGFKHDWWNI